MLNRLNSARLLLLPAAVGVAFLGQTTTAFAADSAVDTKTDTAITASACIGSDALSSVEYKVDGSVVSDLRGNTHQGSKVQVTFQVADGCADVPVGLATYKAPTSAWDPTRAGEQELTDHETGRFGGDGKTHTLGVTLASCNYQVDFFTGPLVNNLTETSGYNSPTSNLISADNGGTKTCDIVVDQTTPTKNNKPKVNPQEECPSQADERVSKYSYTINGTRGFADLSTAKPGDTVVVDFNIAAGCNTVELSLVAYEAPSAEFSRETASQQKLSDSATGSFGSGNHTMSVTAPACYFQIDFVEGGVLPNLGPANSNNFYGDQDRLIDWSTGGTTACSTPVVPTEVAPTVTPAAPAEVLGEVVLAAPAEQANVAAAQLANTGTNGKEMVLLGSALVLMGVALDRAVARRRRII